MVDVNTRSFYAKKFLVMSSPVSECDTKNTDLSKLGSYRISNTAQYHSLKKKRDEPYCTGVKWSNDFLRKYIFTSLSI